MWKFVKIPALMVVNWIVATSAASLLVLFLLRKDGNEGNVLINMVLVHGAGLLGFLAPPFLVSYMDRRGGVLVWWGCASAPWKIVVTFALMVISGVISFLVTTLVLLIFGMNTHVALVGAGALVIVGFLAPGVIVWYLHDRGTSKSRS